MTTNTSLNYLHPSVVNKLSQLCLRHTSFHTFEELIDSSNNFRPVFYERQKLEDFEKDELNELAEAYDTHMKNIQDPRRIYRCN
jgi:hypothetical protein